MNPNINQAPYEGTPVCPTAAHSVIQNTKHAPEADTLKRVKSEGSNVYVQRHTNRHTTTEGHCSIDGGRRLKGGDR